MINYYLHDGIVFDNHKDFRDHFENCEKCKPAYEKEKEMAKEWANDVFNEVNKHSVIILLKS